MIKIQLTKLAKEKISEILSRDLEYGIPFGYENMLSWVNKIIRRDADGKVVSEKGPGLLISLSKASGLEKIVEWNDGCFIKIRAEIDRTTLEKCIIDFDGEIFSVHHEV